MAAHSSKPPEPVATRAGVVTALAVLSALLVKAGASDVSVWLTQNSDWISGAILAAAPVASGWLARGHVTPVADPRDEAGNKLAPVLPVTPVSVDSVDVLAVANTIHPAT